jgi:long-chain fatty acid transport protein
MASLGAFYRVNDRFAVSGGVALDQTPVTDSFRSVMLPDQDRLLFGLGFEYKPTESLVLSAAYQHAFAARHADMNKSVNNADAFAQAVHLSGNYDVNVPVVSLSVRYRYN